jgi:hypothetical protein
VGWDTLCQIYTLQQYTLARGVVLFLSSMSQKIDKALRQHSLLGAHGDLIECYPPDLRNQNHQIPIKNRDSFFSNNSPHCMETPND